MLTYHESPAGTRCLGMYPPPHMTCMYPPPHTGHTATSKALLALGAFAWPLSATGATPLRWAAVRSLNLYIYIYICTHTHTYTHTHTHTHVYRGHVSTVRLLLIYIYIYLVGCIYIYICRGHVSTVRLLLSDPRSRATYSLTNSSSREVLEAVRGVVSKAQILKSTLYIVAFSLT
jgi:hypothetical protein